MQYYLLTITHLPWAALASEQGLSPMWSDDDDAVRDVHADGSYFNIEVVSSQLAIQGTRPRLVAQIPTPAPTHTHQHSQPEPGRDIIHFWPQIASVITRGPPIFQSIFRMSFAEIQR